MAIDLVEARNEAHERARADVRTYQGVLTIEQLPPAPNRYRHNMKPIAIAAFALAAGLFLTSAGAQQAPPKTPDHSMPMSQAGGVMDDDKMMADMKAADARLEALALTMTSARGDGKVAAMQALLAELVKNQVDMHRHMAAMMHEHMMSQMGHK